MTPKELAALGLAAFGHNWQSPMARTLNVAPRTVRRWAAGDTPVPEGIEKELARAMGWDERGQPDWPRDEWILGEGNETASKTRRGYVIHTRTPRFIARIVDLDELTDSPQPDEGNVDESGVVYRIAPDVQLCEIVWLDTPPAGNALSDLMEAAAISVADL